MCLDDLVADRQADAGSLVFVVGVQAPEQLKDRFVKLGLDSDSVVFDRNDNIRIEMIFESMIRRVGAGFCRCFDLDPRIRALVVLYAVADQICKKLADSVAVAPDVRAAGT